MTIFLTVMCVAIGVIGICLGFITKKQCQIMDEEETERQLYESRIDSTLLLYQENQKALENRIKKLETDLNEAVDQVKKETADAVKKEAALRHEEIESHKAETYLALYGKCFCGVPVVDPKNKPWSSYKWTFGDDHGTK